MHRKGFTLIELVLVITIIGILAVAALPKFFGMSGQARSAARDGVAGAVRAGIAVYRANNMATGNDGSAPPGLDAAPSGVCNTATNGGCFNDIMTNPVNDTNWTKNSATNYQYTGSGAAQTFLYNTTNGAFIGQ